MEVVKATALSARAVLLLAVVSSLTACGLAPSGTTNANVDASSAACSSSAVPNRFVVHWKDGSTTIEQAESSDSLKRNLLKPRHSEIVSAHQDHYVQIQRTLKASEYEVNRLSPGVSAATATWGQTDVDATDAQALADGTGVIVAVVDSGVDITHPQLKNQLAVNTADLPNNGIDDEHNGFVDDTYGYDFASNTGAIADGTEGHGTHVSGIILAEHTGATNAVNGLAPKAKLLALRFMDADGAGYVTDAVRAMNYAVSRGAKIINASWGGTDCDSDLKATIAGFAAKGVLFVAAAGNGDRNNVGFNLDTGGVYPAAYGSLPAQITVGALMQTQLNGVPLDVLAGFSNFSKNLVQLLAPGAQIRSTFPLSGATCNGESDGYCYMDGTSMATPFVSGTAALLWSYRPKATVAQVKAAIMTGITAGHYPTITGGKLNAKLALDALAQVVAP